MNFAGWRRAPLLLFVSSLFVYNLNLQRIASGDTVGASLLPFSVLLRGSLNLDPFVPWFERNTPQHTHAFIPARGHFYSEYPIGMPLLATPLYIPVAVAAHVGDWSLDRIVIVAGVMEKLAASLLAALSVVLFYLLALEVTSPVRALWLSLLFAFATETWTISSQGLWQHGGTALTTICAMLFLARYLKNRVNPAILLLAGLAAGWAAVVRPTGFIFVAGAFVWLAWNRYPWRELFYFLAAPLALISLFAAYNWYVTGNPLGYYGKPLSGSFRAGFSGILISPARGLFIYTPVFVFSLLGAVVWLKQRERYDSPVFFLATVFTLAQILLASKWALWWGGDCYGPRILTDIVPGMVLLMIPAFDAWGRLPVFRVLLATAALLSVSIQAIGAFCYPSSNWDLTPVPTSVRRDRYWDWADNPIRRSIAAGPRIGPEKQTLSRILETLRK